MPRKTIKNPAPPDPIQLFAAARIMQSAHNAWTTCRHWQCVINSHCIGGPRGTCRATGGFPMCSEEGKRRLDMYRGRRQWVAESGHEHEGDGERSARHMEVIARRIDRQATAMEMKTETEKLKENLKKLEAG